MIGGFRRFAACSVLLGALVAGACAQQGQTALPQAGGGQTAALFQCRNVNVQAVFGDRQARLTLGEQNVVLNRVEVAQGRFYKGNLGKDAVTFREEGGSASLIVGHRSYPDCTRVSAFGPQASYTALGRNPDWNLAISRDLIRLDRPDWPRLTVPANRRPGAQTQRRFSSRTPDHQVDITLVDRRCEDARSGAVFADTVSVRVNGRNYSGCGGRILRFPS